MEPNAQNRGLSCADDNFPGVYSRISSQYDWIRSKVCEHSTSPPGYLECIPRSPLSGNIFADDLLEPTTTPLQSPPTMAPTRSPLPSGLERIRIEIELDDYPSHTGWSLSSTIDGGTSPGEIIFEMPIGAYDETDRGLRVYEFEIESDAFYTITILDGAADGFDGTLSAYRDGVPSSSNRLVHEPGFTSVSGSSVTHAFYAGDDPPAYLTLVFDFDYYAHEVAWQVEDEDSGAIMGLVWFDTYEAGTDGISVVVPIYNTEWGDRKYSLTLWWVSYGFFLRLLHSRSLLGTHATDHSLHPTNNANVGTSLRTGFVAANPLAGGRTRSTSATRQNPTTSSGPAETTEAARRFLLRSRGTSRTRPR